MPKFPLHVSFSVSQQIAEHENDSEGKETTICLSLTVTDEAHGAASLYHIYFELPYLDWLDL